MEFELKQDAIFISDAHANENRPYFFEFLKNTKKNLPKFSQIFFMGDMFDFLANTTFTQKFYQKEINLINQLSQIYEIFYFEGNHDFNLKNIFPKVKVFNHKSQPVLFKTKFNQKILLAHGDLFLPILTQNFMLFLRNKPFLKVMNFLDLLFKFKISKAILKSQKDKILYKKFINFDKYIAKKLINYDGDYVIEGHYHQDVKFQMDDKIYINLNSYAVTQKIYVVNFSENGLILNGI
ncbi:UDP-2,3-diacylglucosamine diphosphatase [Campylobacter sp. FMV-PI01]|uniref:UDP-2,3-diacylglucosamine diphosphatase n=1 Tax=Campylobacter portucalensis TaxID=2608384 RepID=A0A6L5WFE2_9BACT|nr:metallophosphoesterase [Campylobacter portucalensis]MSN95654.1 UDP-2,3-diacylglucosamine diphosphatase [Campylobacter portucalensis]